jgi:serine/threonine protein kinase
MKEKIGYFIDESSIFYQDFFPFLEAKDKQIDVVYDEQLPDRVLDLQNIGRYLDSYALMCFFGLMQNLKNTSSIETKGMFDFTQLEKTFGKYDQFYFLTQNDALLRRIPKTLLKKAGFFAAKIQGDKLMKFELNDEEQKTFKLAYYLDKDPYMSPIKDSNIQVVFSPKIGFLSLDRRNFLSGGEGNLYRSTNGWMVKIYNEKHQTYPNLKKLQKMLTLDVFDDRIVWPKDIVYFQGKFVGYVMKTIEGASPVSDIFNLGINKFPNKRPYYRVSALLNILQAIDYLHQKNILVGDLKDDNILIRSHEEIYIVDAGSFQVEDYASNVLTRGWVDTNLNKKFDAKKNLRKMEDEYYPINRLAFEFLTAKNPHFNPNNTELDLENTESFYFPLNPKENGPPVFSYWAAYSQRIRDMLYYYFIDPDNRKISYLEELIAELSKEKIRMSQYK